MPGAKVVESRDDYLYVQFSTRLMKFVDDAEFWFDPAAGVVQVRSASRLGRKDFGVNRERIESIRQALADQRRLSNRISRRAGDVWRRHRGAVVARRCSRRAARAPEWRRDAHRPAPSPACRRDCAPAGRSPWRQAACRCCAAASWCWC